MHTLYFFFSFSFFFCLFCALHTEIDYTSGDIDATMSIHSWSYAPKGEEGEFGLVKAGSVRSLPGLSYDGGRFGDSNMAAVVVLFLWLISKLRMFAMLFLCLG